MGIRFRKSVSLLPGVRVNLGGRRGPSVTIGPRGANVNIGPSGSYANVGLPGTGISSRTRIDSVVPQESRRTVSASMTEPRQTPGWVLVLIGIVIGVVGVALLT